MGAPMSTLEDVLVPIYLLHRYQTEAAAKVLGGLYYTYAVRGDGQKITERIPGAEQSRALQALLRTIDPKTLTLPESLIALIPPRAEGYPRTQEDFRNRTGLTFDPVGAAESAASLTVELILNPQRAARLVQYHAEDSSVPSLDQVIDRLLAATWRAAPAPGLGSQVQRAVDSVVLYDLMSLAANESAPAQVRAIAFAQLARCEPGPPLKLLLTKACAISTPTPPRRSSGSKTIPRRSAFRNRPSLRPASRSAASE